jgi:hypothetical protein
LPTFFLPKICSIQNQRLYYFHAIYPNTQTAMPTPSINLHKYASAILLLLTICTCLRAQTPTQIKGVFPQMAIISDHKDRTEAGIGAVIPWANKLWAVGYVAHIRGSGLGLYEISPDMTSRRHPASFTGTYANRFIHNQSDQAFMALMPSILSAEYASSKT